MGCGARFAVAVGYVQIVRSREGQPLPYNGVGRSFIRNRGDDTDRSFSGDRKGLPYHSNITSVVTVGIVHIVRFREGQPLPYEFVSGIFPIFVGEKRNVHHTPSPS